MLRWQWGKYCSLRNFMKLVFHFHAGVGQRLKYRHLCGSSAGMWEGRDCVGGVRTSSIMPGGGGCGSTVAIETSVGAAFCLLFIAEKEAVTRAQHMHDVVESYTLCILIKTHRRKREEQQLKLPTHQFWIDCPCTYQGKIYCYTQQELLGYN